MVYVNSEAEPIGGEIVFNDSSAEELYKGALALYAGRYYQQAITKFEEFVSTYPDHKLAANAQYWVGESYYSQRRFAEAVDAFAKVEKAYPTSHKVPAALLKKGLCFAESKRMPEAIIAFRQIVHMCSQSEEATKAKERLKFWDVEIEEIAPDVLQALMQKAAQGDVDAQRKLGRLNDNGDGVAENDAEAIKWYRRASEQGDAPAQFNLGLMYADGSGVPVDAVESVKWYRRSAEQGYPPAQVNLGQAYHLGVGVPEDFIEAYKWFILAAAQGGSAADLAKKKRDIIAQEMTPGMISVAQERARNWHPQPAKAADGQAPQQPSELAEPSASGSGFFLNNKGDLITNYHVVNGCSSLRVWYGGTPHPASVTRSDERNDLALLRSKDGDPSGKAALRSSSKVALGEQVVVAGYPLRGLLADSLNISSGNVSSLAGPQNDSRLLQVSAPVQPGNSGGPLFDQSGLVIGVVVAKLDAVAVAGVTGDIPQNVNFAITGAVLRSFLEVNDTEFTTEAPGRTLKPEEIASKARLSTVAVECMK
jgi:tol-pal system protein YbgF